MKILFLDDKNMYESDPFAYLVQIPQSVNNSILHLLEKSQPGVGHIGGNWRKILEDGNIEFRLLSTGRESDYTSNDYDEAYKVISGNY